MKALFILFLCFGTVSALATIPSVVKLSEANLTNDSTKQEFFSKEFLTYYKNGNLKRKRTVFYTMDGEEYQTIDENFRKSGTKRNRWVVSPSHVLQLTKYNREGLMRFERNYYYSGPFLESVETRRPNGKVRVQEQPDPEAPTYYRFLTTYRSINRDHWKKHY